MPLGILLGYDATSFCANRHLFHREIAFLLLRFQKNAKLRRFVCLAETAQLFSKNIPINLPILKLILVNAPARHHALQHIFIYLSMWLTWQ